MERRRGERDQVVVRVCERRRKIDREEEKRERKVKKERERRLIATG